MHGDQSSVRIERTDTQHSNASPFLQKKTIWSSFLNALLATALFRCYNVIFFFTAWAVTVTLINHQKIYDLNFQSTLLTVVGTVIGFVISYRTTSSFERYNEGRRLWSQMIFHSRTFARTVWFHIPDIPPATPDDAGKSQEHIKARTLVEKKTVVNLIEAFAVSVKHYLRGEEGCYYEDLYPLVKFLPAYALPNALPSPGLLNIQGEIHESKDDPLVASSSPTARSAPHLPLHSIPPPKKRPPPVETSHPSLASPTGRPYRPPLAPPSAFRPSIGHPEDPPLLPSRMPQEFSYLDVFPFSLLVRFLTSKGKEVKGRKAARLRARRGRGKRGYIVSHNVPLEITLYLSSYIAALQRRKSIDVPTTNQLTASLNGLVDALTGLERILTTPIPFSYSVHLWTVTTLYCLALIWKTMGWLTIPATSILSFIFFGFLTAGEEIENPFGYDKNDLDLDYFVYAVIRPELMAITSLPTPEPGDWAFSPLNDLVFDAHNLPVDGNVRWTVERGTPDAWVEKGSAQIRDALTRAMERARVIY